MLTARWFRALGSKRAECLVGALVGCRIWVIEVCHLRGWVDMVGVEWGKDGFGGGFAMSMACVKNTLLVKYW
jgi:hypothetical protein